MADGVVEAVSRTSRGVNGLVTDVKVQVLGSALRVQVAAGTSSSGEERRLIGNARTTRS